MTYPLRERGLQIDSTLTMGNSLYAVLVGVIVSVITVVLSSRDLGVFGLSEGHLSCRLCMLVVVLLWIAYYLVDWHDLNRVPFIDEYIGMTQMLAYFVCILVISVCITLALLGNISLVAVIASVYCPLVARFRNKLLDEAPESGTLAEAFERGKRVQTAKTRTKVLNVALVLLCVIGFLSGCLGLLAQKARVGDAGWLILLGETVNPFAAVLIMAIGLVAKYHRSKNRIEPEYQAAIAQMRDWQRRCLEKLRGEPSGKAVKKPASRGRTSAS